MSVPAPYYEYLGRRFQARPWRGGYVITCALCGTPAALDYEVSVGSDGAMTVSPSVVCPRTGCTWHVFIKDGEATQA